MAERDENVEQFRDLTWFIELLQHNFEHLAEARMYTVDQFRRLEQALNWLEPVADELDHLLVNLGILPE